MDMFIVVFFCYIRKKSLIKKGGLSSFNLKKGSLSSLGNFFPQNAGDYICHVCCAQIL